MLIKKCVVSLLFLLVACWRYTSNPAKTQPCKIRFFFFAIFQVLLSFWSGLYIYRENCWVKISWNWITGIFSFQTIPCKWLRLCEINDTTFNPLSSLFWCSVWNAAGCLDHVYMPKRLWVAADVKGWLDIRITGMSSGTGVPNKVVAEGV